MSETISTAIELWHNLEIDDDELMEIAIRDVTYQIKLQANKGTNLPMSGSVEETEAAVAVEEATEIPCISEPQNDPISDSSRRFNPRKDPTILFLEMEQLSCRLEDFKFRIEPKKNISIFDPVFEGTGALTINNVSLKVGLECRKERIVKLGNEVKVPVLLLQEFDLKLAEVKLVFRETGIDWLLNPVVSGLSDSITEIIQATLKEQMESQIQDALDHVNSFIERHPHILLHVLGISMEDLDESIVWV